MKNGFFYMKFFLVLLGLIGFANIKAADPIVIQAVDDAKVLYQMDIQDRNGGGLSDAWQGIQGSSMRGSSAEYTVSIPTAGAYDLKFNYANMQPNRGAFVKINNQLPVVVRFSGASGGTSSTNWDSNDGTQTIQVYFDAGDNTLVIGAYQIDGKADGDDGGCLCPIFEKYTITPSAINVAKLADEFSFDIDTSQPAEKVDIDADHTWEEKDEYPNINGTDFEFKGFGGRGDYRLYNFDVPEGQDGLYTLIINYASGDDRNISLNVNDGDTQVILGKNTGRWGGDGHLGNNDLFTNQLMLQFNLHAGANTLKFVGNSDGNWYPDVAGVEFIKYGEYKEVVEPVTFPIVIKAVDDAKVLYQMDIQDRNGGGLSDAWQGTQGSSMRGSSATYTVSVADAGTYDLKFNYANMQPNRGAFVKINNQLPVVVRFSGASGGTSSTNWDSNDGTQTIQVYLDAGENTLVIGAYQIDGKADGDDGGCLCPIFEKYTITPSAIDVSKLADEFSFKIDTSQPAETVDIDGDHKWEEKDNEDININETTYAFKGFGGRGDYRLYNFDVPEGQDGLYTLIINYASGDDRNISLNVNDGDTQVILGKNMGRWGGDDHLGNNDLFTNQLMLQFNLHAGANTLKFVGNSDGNWYPDVAGVEFIKYGEYQNVVPEFPKILPAGDATKFEMGDSDFPDGRDGKNGHWMAYGGVAAHGSYLEWTNVNISTAGTYDLTMQYADAGQDRYATVQINNQQPAVIHFGENNGVSPDGDYSSDWNTNDGLKTVQVYLEAGDNTIRISGYMNAGLSSDGNATMPLFDKVIINPSNMTVSKLPDAYSVTIPALETSERGGDWKEVDYSADGGIKGLWGAGLDVSYLKYDVTLQKDGLYNLVINYACGNMWDPRFINVVVNEGAANEFAQEMKVPDYATGSWGDGPGWDDLPYYKMMTQVNLLAGENTIKIIKSSDGSEFSNFDHFELVRIGDYEGVVPEFPKVIEAENADVQYKMGAAETRKNSDGVDWVSIGGNAKSLYGSYLQYNVTVEEAGTYDLTLQYADAGDDREMWLKVNDQVSTIVHIGDGNFSTSWDNNDGTITVQVYLEAGANTLTLGPNQITEASDQGKFFMPNLDKLIINPSETSIDKLPDGYSFSQDAKDDAVGIPDNWDKHDMNDLGFHGISGNSGYVTYNANIPSGKGGQYTILIDYYGASDRYFTLITNEGTDNEFSYQFKTPSNGTWGDKAGDNGLTTYKVMALVNLTNGVNTLKLVAGVKPDADGGWTNNISSLTFIKIGEYAPDVVVTTIPVTGVSLDATTASLTVGDTQQLTATIQPTDATNQNVTWSSSVPSVATVSNGLITALSAGATTITVTTEDGEFTATCAVTVKLPTGISNVSDEINAYSNNGRLYVNSPVAETIHVYSVSGVLLYNFQKPAGMANYSIEKVQDAVLIVRGDTGWVKKVIR